MNRCGCEDGGDCTRTIVCAVQLAVEDAEEKAHESSELREERIAELNIALTDLLNHYTELVNCGDCGNWDPETEDVVIAARTVLGP